jgi:hypothetical protein
MFNWLAMEQDITRETERQRRLAEQTQRNK